MRILFMGTPDFAVPCLQSILDAGHEVCDVFTQPDKPKGRKFILTPPPVKVLALENNLSIFQPVTLRNQEAIELIKDLHPECIVVVAYGKILPKEILDIPQMGCINVHASLLPKYRGAAPIQWCVINGEKVTGVTTMYMGEGIDTGDMLQTVKTEIDPNETAGELQDRLAQMGAKLIVETLQQIKDGTAKRVPQCNEEATYVSVLKKELSKIDWNCTAQQIHNLVRGLSPWPVASTEYHGKLLKVHKSAVVTGFQGEAGEIANSDGFLVCCGDNTALELVEVQYEGGKKMSGKDFLRGHPAESQTVLK
ncbi:MAG TPA: methionyl-tRNA formyltransferase [Oscillospiraceae bacterium]|nr:methionyl-tRNA formyltransferase [Oscillospiraceae bacterium]